MMPVKPTSPIQLSIEMRGVEGQIAGCVADEQGEQHPFTSWLGLLAVLESARRRASGPPAAPARAPGPKGRGSGGSTWR